MPTMIPLPIVANLEIEAFSGGVITTRSAGVKNGIYDQMANGGAFLQQRPGIQVFEENGGDSQGRGIYYWERAGQFYFINNDSIFQGTYATPVTATSLSFSAGSERCYFLEVGVYLVILDPENNEGWYINSATPTVYTEISDVDFPPNQTPALQLCKGGASLNDTLFVMATNGEIWNSAISDPTAWGSADFVTAEVEQDGGVHLDLHRQHLVAHGNRTTEYFYWASNPTGSPVDRRLDAFADIGMLDADTYWSEGDTSMFLGFSPTGNIAVYRLNGFTPEPISKPDIESFLTTSIIDEGLSVFASGFYSGGRAFYIITLYSLASGAVSSTTSIVYQSTNGIWSEWTLGLPGYSNFPLIAWTKATDDRAGTGITTRGDLITVLDDFMPFDGVSASAVYETGVYATGVYEEVAGTATAISLELVTGPQDFGRRNLKFMSDLRFQGMRLDHPHPLTVETSDESYNSWTVAGTLDMSDPRDRIRRLGSFTQRNFRFRFSEDEQLRIEGIHVELEGGTA